MDLGRRSSLNMKLKKKISNKDFFKRKWILTSYLKVYCLNTVLFHCPVVLFSNFL